MKTLMSFLIIYSLFAFLLPEWTSAQWERTTGLQGGSVTTLMVNKAGVFAGIKDSSIFISRDNGITWKSTNSNVCLGKGSDVVTSFAQLGTSIFVGINRYPIGAASCVYRSQNNGETWDSCRLNIPVCSFLVKKATIFAGTTSGVYLSNDTGASWIAANSGFPSNTTIYSLTSCENNLVAGTNSGLYSSTDNGTNWVQIGAAMNNDTVFALESKGDTIFAGTNNGIYRSYDKGSQWVNCSSSLFVNKSVTSIAINGSNIFAGSKNCGFYISSNDGTDWTGVKTGLARTPVLNIVTNDSTVFVGTDGAGVLASNDNGKIWTFASSGLPFKSQVNSFGTNGNRLFVGTPTGVFTSKDNGDSWVPVNSGLPENNLSYSFANIGNTILVGTGGYGIYSSTDNGSKWNVVNNGLTNRHVSSLIASGNNLFAGTSGGIFFSNDTGNSWSRISNGLADTNVIFLAAGDSKLFALMQHYNGSNICYSIDTGSNWISTHIFDHPGSGSTCLLSFKVIDDNLFIGTYTLMKVRDIGEGVSYSVNNGTTFTPANTGLPSNVFVYDIITDQRNIFIETSSGVYVTSKNNFNWVLLNADVPSNSDSLHFGTQKSISHIAVNESFLFLSINNKGIWRFPLSAVSAKPDHIKNSDQFATKIVKTKGLNAISFSLSRSEMVKVKIYNLHGCEIATLIDNSLKSGLHSLSWNTKNIANGSYTMKIQIGTKTVTKGIPVLQ